MTTKTTAPKPTDPPTWGDYWNSVTNEDWLYARELMELSLGVRGFVAARLYWHDDPVRVDDAADEWNRIPHPDGLVWRDSAVDWEQVAADFDQWGGSSTERRLMRLVLSLVLSERTVHASEDLGNMGSWRGDVAAILARYITGDPPRR